MRLNPLGEELIIVDELGHFSPASLAKAIEDANFAGIVEVAPAWDSVGIYFDPETADTSSLASVMESLQTGSSPAPGKIHQIPCCFEMGEDLEEMSSALGLSVEEVIVALTERSWPVRFLGFQPGFPYCGPLPSPFDAVPRRSSPRTRVPSGSVAIAAGQLGIYPAESPGGWQLVGRTPLAICDPKTKHYPLKPGDEIALSAISQTEFEELSGGSP